MVAKLEGITQKWADTYGLSVATGYSGPNHKGGTCAINYTAYASSGRPCANKCSSDVFAFGSFTKLWTAAHVMKLYEEGRFDIDAPVLPLLQEAYAKVHTRSSLEKKFGSIIHTVTARQLLNMRGGINDYDELDYQVEHPTEDLGPSRSVDLFGQSTGTLPGTCGSYSSMSYVLLGLLLMQQTGAESWDSFEPNPWPELFPDLQFGTRGTCASYTDVRAVCGLCESRGIHVKDLSCTNGFTCGNMIAHPIDAARFVRELFEGRLVNASTLAEMKDVKQLGGAGATKGASCSSWCEGCHYGLGVQAPANGLNEAEGDRFLGHAGVTYGYMSLTAYDREKKGAISVAVANDAIGGSSIWYDIHQAMLGSDVTIV